MGKNKEVCIVQWILDERDSLQGKFAHLVEITREPNLTRTRGPRNRSMGAQARQKTKYFYCKKKKRETKEKWIW